MRKFGILAAALSVIAVATPVLAHHGFDTEYDASKHVKLEGVVTMVSWTNPHMRVYIDVKDKDGKVTNWAVEAGAPNALLRRGLRNSDFPAGVEVTVEGYRAKGGGPTANGTKVTFKDGRNFFLGATDNAGGAGGNDAAPK